MPRNGWIRPARGGVPSGRYNASASLNYVNMCLVTNKLKIHPEGFAGFKKVLLLEKCIWFGSFNIGKAKQEKKNYFDSQMNQNQINQDVK